MRIAVHSARNQETAMNDFETLLSTELKSITGAAAAGCGCGCGCSSRWITPKTPRTPTPNGRPLRPGDPSSPILFP